jgi:amidase
MHTTDSRTDADLAFAGLARQAELVRAGEVTPRELVALSLRRIEALDPRLNAFRAVRRERALAEADEAAARLEAGDAAPLLGVPVAVKDNMEVAGERTSDGTPHLAPPAGADCEAVRRLRRAGAVIVGQTNMPELALWAHRTGSPAHGITRNPWDPGRSPGGSSGGSAAAVAAALVPAALGSDGGGSIRVPAALCGLVGMKPQRGRIPLAPLEEHWSGLTHLGPLTRSVADAALMLDALADGGPYSPAADTDPAPLRIAVSLRTILPTRAKPALAGAVESTATLLRELGHTVVERDPDYPEMRVAFVPRYARGAYEDAERLGTGRGELSGATRGMVRLGARMGRWAERARAREAEHTERIQRLFEDVDVLLTPTVAAPAPPAEVNERSGMLRTFLGGTDWACFTPPWNLTGQPACSLPAGFDDAGMPLGVQLVSRPDDERTLLSLAAQLERARPWAGRRPGVS